MEEYSTIGEGAPPILGMGLVTASGLVQLLGRINSDSFRDPSATALIYGGSGRGGGGNMPFDTAEAQQVATASRNAKNRAQLPGGGFASGVGATIGGLPVSGASGAPDPAALASGAPVRVGGNIRTPQKIVDVPPVLPPAAAQVNLRGVVIVEIVIGPDGAIRDAKVLRSIPLLDQAALDAVRQWRYEPTLLNGAPVPVIMTVTVNFQ